MNFIARSACLFLSIPSFVAAEHIVVRTDDELAAALRAAKPGDEIRLTSGTYRGGIHVTLAGAKDKPIVLTSDDPTQKAVIDGRSGLHLAGSNYVTVSHLRIRGSTGNGLNIDDGGADAAERAVGIRVLDCEIIDTGPKGNTDGIKLSGLKDFEITGCTVEGWGGSAIDMVGCADGVIQGCSITGKDGFDQSSGVQMKGGTTRITVKQNRFSNAGSRALNVGGSTGLAYFRPLDAAYEAKEITVENNLIEGSETAVAFVGVDGAVFRNNTIKQPGKWVMRILQESRDARFAKCRNVIFERNLIEYSRQSVRTFVNIGPDTQPETFVFKSNWWWCVDGATVKPDLPAPETDGVYGRDPKEAAGNYGAAEQLADR